MPLAPVRAASRSRDCRGRAMRRRRQGMPARSSRMLRSVAGLAAPVDALGHSMGGFALIAYALAWPSRVCRLVLVGTGAGGCMSAPGALWNRSHPRFAAMALFGILQIILPWLGPKGLLRNLIEREPFIDRRLARPTRLSAADWLRRKPVEATGTASRGDSTTDVISGRHHAQFPLACSLESGVGLAGARTASFDQSGHYSRGRAHPAERNEPRSAHVAPRPVPRGPSRGAGSNVRHAIPDNSPAQRFCGDRRGQPARASGLPHARVPREFLRRARSAAAWREATP